MIRPDLGKIHYAKPSITQREVQYASDAAANGWGEHCYDYIRRFETLFAQHLNVTHAMATSSATGALHLGMAALGIGPGDEVIAGDINWVATVAPIVHLGATPVLVDVLADSWCIDPAEVERAITPRTRAIVAVHLYGNLCDMTALEAIAAKRGIPIIEDAAEAIGSAWQGVRAGSRGAFGAFSFHGTKTVTTGEGGMFVTRDSELYDRALTLSNHGRASGEPRQFWPAEIGYKYKLANVQAAIGCAQMERIDELIAGKRRVFEYYRRGLAGLPVRLNPEPPGTTNGFWMPTIIAQRDGFDREATLEALRRENIDARVFFWPLSLTPPFVPRSENPVSYALYRNALNLPSYHDLTEAEMDRVLGVLRDRLQ